MSEIKIYPFCPLCSYRFLADLCTYHSYRGIEKPIIEEKIISGLTGDRDDGEY